MQSQKNLLGLTRQQLKELVVDLGEKSFRADQIFKWIHQRFVSDFAEMTDIKKETRDLFQDNFVITAPPIAKEELATDGVIKWLLDVGNNNYVETVFIPEKNRATLCISSQVGCMLNCTFCSTATQGFNKNLTPDEIIGQLWQAERRIKELGVKQERITNVVMMGMGEPLLNTQSVFPSLTIMRDEAAYGLSKRRVTVSTSGVVPGIDKLKDEVDVALAISLHAPNNPLRNEIVPINKKYPIKVLLDSCKGFLSKKGKRDKITIEYVMLKGVNDSLEHAKELVKTLSNVPSKINLIPFNPFPGARYTCSSKEQITNFAKYIEAKGLIVTVRKTRGQDIAAACGQLVGDVKDKTKRHARFIASLKIQQEKQQLASTSS